MSFVAPAKAGTGSLGLSAFAGKKRSEAAARKAQIPRMRKRGMSMTLRSLWRRWREDRATLFMLERLDERSRAELATLIRIRRDAAEFDSKTRGVRAPASLHIADTARRAHS